MIIKLLTFLFNKVIGELPEDKRKELMEAFNKVMTEAVKATTEGAIEGLKR